VVPDGNGRDAFADGLDNSAGFVAEDGGEEAFGVCAGQGVDVRVAQGVGDNLDANFAGFRRGHNDLDLAEVVHAEGDEGFAFNRLRHGGGWRRSVPRK